MAQCRTCGEEIVFVDKGTDPHTGKKRWVPHNPDLSPHVCRPTQSTQSTQPTQHVPVDEERRECAMWAVNKALVLTSPVSADLDTRIHLVADCARKLYALVDLVASGGPVPSPVTTQEPSAVAQDDPPGGPVS